MSGCLGHQGAIRKRLVRKRLVTLYPSNKFCELVKSSMLLVFDEFHKVKNENAYSSSIRALIRPV